MVSKRILSRVIGLALVSLFVVACGTPPTPRIIEHPRPTLASDASIVYKDWEAGDRCLWEEVSLCCHSCAQVRVELDDTFRLISTQEELRDLFAPIESYDEALSYALLATGYSAKYEPEDYRLAVTGDCDPGPKGYRYYVDALEDTHVVEVENGYQVYLFASETFGCGPHPVWSVPVQVNNDGAITIHPIQKLFEEGRGPMCCVD